MSGVGGVGGAPGALGGVDRVMQMRAQILERNQALARANQAAGAAAPTETNPTSFAHTNTPPRKDVKPGQQQATPHTHI